MPVPTKAKESLTYYMRLIREQKSNVPEEYLETYSAFYASLENLNSFTEKLYTPDENGNYPAMSQEDLDTITGYYNDAMNRCDSLIDSAKENLPQGNNTAPAVVTAVKELLAADIAVISTIKEADGASLPDTIDRARSITLSIDRMPTNTVGAALSSRVPVKYEVNGKTVKGFFTPSLRSVLHDEYVALFTELKNTSGADYEKELSNMLDPAVEKKFLERALREPGISSFADMKEFGVTLVGRRGEQILEKITDFTEARIGHYNKTLKVEEGARVDTRNSALSDVAALSGIPNIVARAQGMTIVDADGVVYEGTFMETAEGEIPDKVSPYHDCLQNQGRILAKLNTPGDFVAPEGICSLAQLDAIDYICHNSDRHNGNFAYQWENRNGVTQLVGVQGYDNDSSFGRKIATASNRDFRERSLDSLLVIPRSLAEQLQHIDKNVLKLALRNNELPEPEIDATIKRLDSLNERITRDADYKGEPVTGKLRIVSDSEWAQIDFDKLAKAGRVNSPTENIFAVTVSGFMSLKPASSSLSSVYYNYGKVIDKTFNDYVTSFTKGASSFSKELSSLDENLRIAEGLTSRGSPQFADMSTSFDELRAVLSGEAFRQNGAAGSEVSQRKGIRERQITGFDAESDIHQNRLQIALENLSSRADIYLQYKGTPFGSTAKKRVETATRLKRFADTQLKALRENRERNDRKKMEMFTKSKKLYASVSRLPEGSDLRKLGERALQAQSRLISYAYSNLEEQNALLKYSPEELERLGGQSRRTSRTPKEFISENVGAMIAFDMMYRTHVAGKFGAKNEAELETVLRSEDAVKKLNAVRLSDDAASKLISGISKNATVRYEVNELTSPGNLIRFIESDGQRVLNDRMTTEAHTEYVNVYKEFRGKVNTAPVNGGNAKAGESANAGEKVEEQNAMSNNQP